MKYLVIAEKPSVKNEISKVWGKATSIPADFDNFFGHLMTLQMPGGYDPKYENKRDPSILPLIPEEFVYLPSEDRKDKVKELTDKIKFGGYDFVVNACDADKEGELIFWSFYKQMGLKVPTKRLWVQDPTEKGYIVAIKSLIDESAPELIHLQEAARLRAKMDWLYGMNYSRAASIAVNSSLPIGRVMTPTLAILAEREEAITNFKPTPYFELWLSLHKKGETDCFFAVCFPEEKSTKFLKKEDAEKVKKSLKAGLKVDNIESIEQKLYAPTLFSLTELQKEASKKFGYSANQTLSIAQALYEKHKLITYPRSECRYIPTNMVKEIPARLKALSNIKELEKFVTGITPTTVKDVLSTKKYVDDSKLASHHAIIPTDKKPDAAALSKEELNVYTLIGKRLIALFLGPYVSEKTVVTLISSSGSTFKARGKVEKQKGYSVLYAAKSEDVILPSLKEGEIVCIKEANIEDKETTPPKRFTDDSLLDAMLSAGKDLKEKDFRDILKEVSGIGTPATRAGIIEKILSYGWAEKKGKAFYVTPSGMSSIKALGKRPITSPALTAEWELKLREIEEGKTPGNKVYKELCAGIGDEVKSLLSIKGSIVSRGLNIVGSCPCCGGSVVEGKTYYLCKEYKKTCDFVFGKTVLGAKISLKDAEKLLKGEKIEKKLTFEKDGKKTKTTKLLQIKDGRLSYIKSEVKETDIECPFCGGKVKQAGNALCCENSLGENSSCSFRIPASYCGHVFSADEISFMAKGYELACDDLISKKGNSFSANISLDKETGLKVEFISTKEAVEKGKMPVVGKCPVCGEDVLESTKVYICSNYDESGCEFKLSKEICGAKISASDVKLLLNGGRTSAKKFKFKSGKEGLAKLYFDDGELKFDFSK